MRGPLNVKNVYVFDIIIIIIIVIVIIIFVGIRHGLWIM